MGNILSSDSTRVHVTSESEAMNDTSDSRDQEGSDVIDEVYLDAIKEDETRTKSKEDEMIKFRKELSVKREQRKQILARHKAEKQELEKKLNEEKTSRLELCKTNKLLRELLARNNIEIPDSLESTNEDYDITTTILQMKEEFENLKSNNNTLRSDLAESNKSLQNAYADIAELNGQNIESMKQISALKEVVSVSKTMVTLREQQLNELKNKLSEIEKSLADREASMLSTDLKQEYERQLQNIRTLRGLYEERARLAEVTRQSLVRELEEQKILYEAEVIKSKNLTEKVKELEDRTDALIQTIDNKNNQISLCKEETFGLRAEMTVVNKLFSEVLLGYKTKKDLDKLANRLEENHGILTQMAERESDSEVSTALPKLLLELVNQIDEQEENLKIVQNENSETNECISFDVAEQLDNISTTTPEQIMQNLPKVWRVLMELLSHQNVTEPNSSEKVTTCYKSVETKSGPVLVPSVSQTYIRLKDLIMEKLTLIKEVNRMKQLNSHLETRLGEQERRLCLVTTELSKTWHVVGRLRRHHHQLHTHEKILKYELQQKRKLLNELKEELEYCREKWEQAREKNSQSERDWKELRAEFSSRKLKSTSTSFHQSAESGYSDERPSDDSSESNDESEYVTEPPMRCKKKLKKSFETILDSSTDFNLAAEREDPVSDMLDVADLPLDTHDGSHSDNVLKSEMLYEETEDELGDIDSCLEETNTEQMGEVNSCKMNSGTDINNCMEYGMLSSNIPLPQNNLHGETSNILNVHNNGQNEHHIINCLITGREVDGTNMTGNKFIKATIIQGSENSIDESKTKERTTTSEETDSSSSELSCCSYEKSLPILDFKAILNSVKIQDERLAKKDKRLLELESGCAEVISNINKTLENGEKIKQRLELLHNDNTCIDNSESREVRDDSPPIANEPEPSTSNELDHEARFAARDLRLKILEEQTKSLVNKVNKTTTKGVKIHYKLEELHNIYGSESSRAGTPSEEDEETNNEKENSTI